MYLVLLYTSRFPFKNHQHHTDLWYDRNNKGGYYEIFSC